MKYLISFLLVTFNFLITNQVLAQNRVALVIGNANYVAANSLPNDINDAKDMAAVLRGYGFKVITKLDANLTEMLTALDDFGHELDGGGVGLFYYSGHGLEVDGQQYIVPTDAQLSSKTELPYRMVDVNTILKKVGESKTQLNLVILDACRSNPFGKALGIKALNKGFSPIQNAPSGTLIASATAVGDTASGAGDRNSIYTAQLLQFLREKPSDDVRLLLGDVGDAVIKATNNDQIPWTSGSMTGRFYFAETNNTSVSNPTPQQTLSTPDNWQLIDHYQVKDGLAKDITTGLLWMRCSIGQTWNGSSCAGNATEVNWEQAMGIPKNIEYAGYSDWRLPTREELKSIVYCSSGQTKTYSDGGTTCDGEYTKPTIAQAVFPNTPIDNYYWSASPVADDSSNAWIVSFYGGSAFWDFKDSKPFVRLVRAGQ